MSNTVDNYLFLGLPQSGKTTYFSLMVKHLQDAANHTKLLRFLYLPTENNQGTDKETDEDITSKFIDVCVSRIEKQRWPPKTGGYEVGYSFELDKFFSFFGKPILQKYFYRKAIFDYHDYPGEAFEVAFGIGDAPTQDMKKAADDMKSRIKTAKGLFLILDSDALFNGQDNKKYRTTLTHLFQCIRNTNRDIKLAIVFNKLELFYGVEPDFRLILRDEYGNAYAHLPYNHKYFNVYPLGNVETADNGGILPPKKLIPKDILEPVKWMIGF